jgi:glycosyltransferase involved in cell wall biosynthesis
MSLATDSAVAPTAPRVSIAMATCQGERFLAEQLDSLAAQTLPPDQLVVCDDASTDRTSSIVESFSARAPFEVVLRRNPTRLGTTGNFERATSLCDGEVIFFSDQDDYWLPEKIERVLAVFDTNSEIGAVLHNGRVVDGSHQPLGYDLWQAVGFVDSEQAMARAGHAADVFLRHVVAAGTTLAFLARFKPLLLPFPELRSAHDAWAAFMIASVAEFALLDAELIDYRLHGDNQFGLKLFDLRAQYAQAKVQVEERAFAYAGAFFREARSRLANADDGTGRPSRELLALIDAKIEHSDRRDLMSGRLLGRLPDIMGEAIRGRYGRYSYGWKSVAQDIFLR